MGRKLAAALAFGLWAAVLAAIVAGPARAAGFAEKVTSGEALTLGDLFEAGGQIMWILVALSVMAVGTAAYLFAVLREAVVAPPELSGKLLSLLRAGEADAAAGLVTSGGSALARIARAGFRRSESGVDEVSRAVESSGRREVAHLRTTVNYLSSVAVIAPMLGLLGTVIGMMQAFGSIAGEEIRVVPLAAAIMKAMVTTAFGLMVGILAMALFYFFRGRLAGVRAEMETVAEEIASLIARAPAAERAKARPEGIGIDAGPPAEAPAEDLPAVTEVAEEVVADGEPDEAASDAADESGERSGKD